MSKTPFMSGNYSKILREAYDQFLLPLGGKKVPTPYRRNEVGSFQKVGPEFQGKSSPEVLIEATQRLAGEQNFNLNKASLEEIRQFMGKNKLGIDCSGFVYRMLDYLSQRLGLGNLQKSAGMEHVGRTNVAKMTSEEFSILISDFSEAKPGDVLKLNSGEDILHGVVILENKDGIITYTHSSNITKVEGVHSDQIIKGKLPDELEVFSYNPDLGDGIYRLRILA